MEVAYFLRAMEKPNSWQPFPAVKVTEPSEVGTISKEKGKAAPPTWPEDNPFEDHYMSTALKKDRPFSEQPTLAPVGSIPPFYGTEHEAARAGAIARSEYIEDVDKSNLVDPQTRNTKKQRLKRHCMRYWICYLLANIILLAIMLPIL